MLPAIFVSHGAPTLVLQDIPAAHFLTELGARLPRPRAILAVSAHWETARPMFGGAGHPRMIYDFGRFDDRLFEMTYPAPGDPALAQRAAGLLQSAGLTAGVDPGRGYDHGVWVPLRLMYPAADIPVVPVAVQPGTDPGQHLQVGRALAQLRAEDVLIIASGSFTHDLHRFRGGPIDAASPPDVDAFAAWFDKALSEGRVADLLAYRTRAPHAKKNHPTEEHLLPLYVALGAGSEKIQAEHLHDSSTYGILRMDAYAFH